MKLYINEKNIPFEMGNEKNAADVVSSLQMYSNENSFVISELIINNKLISQNEHSLQALPINSIEEVRCTMENPIAYTTSLLFEIPQRLEIFNQNHSRQHILNNFENIINRLNWAQDVLKKSGSVLGISEMLLPIEAQVQGLRLLAYGVRNEEKQWDAKAAAQLTSQINANLNSLKLNSQLIIFKSEISRKDLTASTCQQASCILLEKTISECEKIAISFQSGNQLDGLTSIITLIDCIESFQTGCAKLVSLTGSKNIKEKLHESCFKNVISQLNEIKTLMEEENFVELSDIIEYELQPALASLKAHLEGITF